VPGKSAVCSSARAANGHGKLIAPHPRQHPLRRHFPVTSGRWF
jgi:hypothetical protein